MTDLEFFDAAPDGWVVPGYVHERELGTGATGRVFLARDEATGQRVAIKYLAARLRVDDEFRSAYRGEAQLLGQLGSEHVARLYQYVESEDGAAIVMELIEGISLRELLRGSDAPMTPESALAVLKGSLLGLAAAHASQVVHRDYKPANVLVSVEGVSKLVDFGLAARSGASAAAAGTPAYMAPEQFTGLPVLPATDVYAATATFFECVTGTTPYQGADMMELMAQHTNAPIPHEQAPAAVRGLVRSGLAKSPQERPADAQVFVDELERAARRAYGADWELRGRRALAVLVGSLPLLILAGAEAMTTGSASPSAAGSLGRRLVRQGRSASTVGVAAAVLVALALAGFAMAMTGGTATRPPSASTTPSAVSAAPVPVDQPATPGTTPTPASATSPRSTPTSPSPPPSVSGSPRTTAPQPATSPAAKPAMTPSVSSTPSASPSPMGQVYLVSLGLAPRCDTQNWMKINVAVTYDGTAGESLNVAWFTIDNTGARTVVYTEPTVALPAGQTSFTRPFPHKFTPSAQIVGWGVTVSTTPAALIGNNATQTCP